MNKSALLVIDVQAYLFSSQRPVYRSLEMLNTLWELLSRARKAGVQVVFTRYNGEQGNVDAPGSPGWEIHPSMQCLPGEPIIDKQHDDSFQETGLKELLDRKGITHLIFAGVQTEYCIEATLRRAVREGYTVTLVADAHSTCDTRQFSARHLVENANQNSASIAEVLNARDVEF